MNIFLKKQTGTISPLVILAVIAILAVAGYFVFDSRRGFSVSYPEGWIVTEIMGSTPKDPGRDVKLF